MASRFSISARFKGLDSISKPVSKMGNAIAKFTRRSNRKIAKLGKNFKKLGSFMGKAVIGGAAIAAAAIGAVVFKTAALGDEMATTSRLMGITAESLQELRFAADRQGVSAGVLSSSFLALQKRVGELKSGTGSLFSFLKKTGDKAFIRQLSLAKDTEEAFELITAKAATIEDPLKKAAFASAAFSRSGIAMLSFMEAGVDGIKDLRLEARKYGAVISNEATEESEVFIDSLANLTSSLSGIGKTFATKLIPSLTTAMQRFADFWALNKDIISVGMDKFLSFLGDTFRAIKPSVVALFQSSKKLFGIFFEAVSSLLPKFTVETSDLSDGMKSLLGFLKTMVDVGVKAFEFIKFISPFLKPFLTFLLIWKGLLIAIAVATKGWAIAQGILNGVMAVNPISLIIIGIAILITAIIFLVANWDSVIAVLKNVWDWFSKLLDNPMIAAAGVIFAPFITIPALIIKHWEPIKTFFVDLWDGIINSFTNGVEFITSIINKVDTFIENKVGGIIDTIGNIAAKFGIDLGIGKGETEENKTETPQVISPAERVARSIEEKTSVTKSTLTIKDESGRAELEQGKGGGIGLQLVTSGDF